MRNSQPISTARFNSCPREGAIEKNVTVQVLECARFNSCPREGAIHEDEMNEEYNYDVSTHAPARGQSMYWLSEMPTEKFQLMPPRGGNRNTIQGATRDLIVSTHAPARGQS